MKNKDKLKQLLSQAKTFNAEKKAADEKKLAEEKNIAQALNQINNTNTKEKPMKKLSKQVKHDLALIKMIGQMKASESKVALTEQDFTAMINEYAEEKAIELTSDHSNLLRTTQSSDMIFSFDEKSEAGAILALFNRYDLPVNGSVQVPVDDQSVELQHLAETAAVSEQTWNESLLTLSSSRAALAFKLSRSLQFKSIVDQMAYVERLMSTAVAKGLVEGIINGQGTSTQVDSGYASTKMGTKMAGIRAKLSAASYTSDAATKDLDSTDGKAVLQAMFDAAGARFSRNQSSYVILANRKQKLKISELVKGAGVTGINTAAASQVYANSYQGVPVIECAFLISNTAASGSGVSETGFVSSTAADNDHSALILLDPTQVWYHIGGERVDVEYKPSTDSFEITLNCQAGWNMLCDSKNQPGVFLINIGANIA